MQITEEMVSTSINTIDTNDTLPAERPPACFLPEGDTIIRLWVAIEDSKLVWLREDWMYQMKGVGIFDGNHEFFKGIAMKAKEADPEKKWAWRYQSQRIGIIKGAIYQDDNTPLASGADPKYVRPNIPTIIVLNNTALKSFKKFMAAQIPSRLQAQLDPDKPAMGILFSLKRGSGATCNVSWSLQERELPAPFTWGDKQEFPPLSECFINGNSVPTQDQKDLISADLHNRISSGRPESDVPF